MCVVVPAVAVVAMISVALENKDVFVASMVALIPWLHLLWVSLLCA
jgi:hypothetical protein